jgi:hypothetical protein
MKIESTSPLLLPHERQAKEKIAERLRDQYGKPPLPSGYQQSIEECFGGDGDSRDRGRR